MSFKNTSEKMATSMNNKGKKKMAKIIDNDVEVNKFFTARITRLDHFEGIVKGILRTLNQKTHLEELFKAFAFDQLVYGVDGLKWSIQLVYKLLLSLLKQTNEEGSLCFRLRPQDIKFERAEFALITRLKFGNNEEENHIEEASEIVCQVFPRMQSKDGGSRV